jgi:hypothetical protein
MVSSFLSIHHHLFFLIILSSWYIFSDGNIVQRKFWTKEQAQPCSGITLFTWTSLLNYIAYKASIPKKSLSLSLSSLLLYHNLQGKHAKKLSANKRVREFSVYNSTKTSMVAPMYSMLIRTIHSSQIPIMWFKRRKSQEVKHLFLCVKFQTCASSRALQLNNAS